MEIRINATAVLGKLNKLEKGLARLDPFFTQAEKVLEDAKNRQFAYEGSYLDKKWKPLAPSTLRQKRGPSILVETGKLKSSFKPKEKTPTSMAYGSTSDYYKYHQLGTRKMPRRVILNVNDNLRKEIVDVFKNYLTSLLYG